MTRLIPALFFFATAGLAQSFPPVPALYGDVYSSLSSQIASFSNTVNTQWNHVPYPVLYAPHLTSASASQGAQLLNSGSMTQVLRELQEHQALGAKSVVVDISFPVLNPAFYSTSAEYQQYLNFYVQLAGAIRARGMKLIVETQAVVPQPGLTTLNPVAYYNSLTWQQYETGRAQTAVIIAQYIKPDYMSILVEPDTEATQSGKAEINTVSGSTEMINAILAALAQSGVHGISVGAGVGTWLASFQSFVQSFTTTAVQYIDIHLYPINGSYLSNALTIADMAHSAGKQVAMSEFWLSKERDSELGVLTYTDIFARNPFSFWMPLDIAYLQALSSFSQYKQMLFVAPYWDQFFFANVDYNLVAALSAEQILAQTGTATSQALSQAQFTATGLAWEKLILPGTDTAAPSVPANFAAQPGYGAISLTWSASTDNVGVAGYKLYRDGAPLARTADAAFNDMGLKAGATHMYSIVAFDAAGNTSAVKTISATVLSTSDKTPPTKPTNLVAKGISTTQINLSWSPSTDNVGVYGYAIYRGTSPTSLSAIGNSAVTSFADANLAPSTLYYYAVAAYDRVANFSLQSAVVSASPLADTTPPSAPTGVTATTISISQIHLSWKASTDNTGVASYVLYRGTTATNLTQIGGAVSPTTIFDDPYGMPGTKYYYSVAARDLAGNISTQSSVVSAATAADTTPPSIPQNLRASAISSTQVNLSWSASTDNFKVAYYRIYRGTSPSTLNLLATSAATSDSDTKTVKATKYYYSIAAQDVSGNLSAQTTPVLVTTP